jgi:acyl-CoA synthetase (AMP-forming)/AMP-acid ligase II
MFRRPLPLIARVTIALAVVAVLPLGYAVWSLFDVNRAGMHEQVLRTHAVAASSAAERISTLVATRRSLASSLARFKRPREYRLVASLPKSASGKILRRVLRDKSKESE